MSKARRIGLLAGLVALLAVPAHALAAAGDVLVSGDDNSNTIIRISPDGTHHVVASGAPLYSPGGFDLMPSGMIFEADYLLPGIVRVNPKTHKAGVRYSGPRFAEPTDLVRGPDGKLYVTDRTAARVDRLDPVTGKPVVLAKNIDGATAITLDGAGNLLVAGRGVYRIKLATGASTLVPGTATSLPLLSGIARAPSGEVYVDSLSDDTIYRVSLATGAAQVVTTTGFITQPYGMDVTPGGDLLVANDDNPAQVVQVNPKTSGQTVINGGTFGAYSLSDVNVVPPSCDGKLATIVGSDKADHLHGTKYDDVIAGLGGDDKIDGRGGDDIICGSGGHDVLKGGPGDDTAIGGPDKDTCSAEHRRSC